MQDAVFRTDIYQGAGKLRVRNRGTNRSTKIGCVSLLCGNSRTDTGGAGTLRAHTHRTARTGVVLLCGRPRMGTPAKSGKCLSSMQKSIQFQIFSTACAVWLLTRNRTDTCRTLCGVIRLHRHFFAGFLILARLRLVFFLRHDS